MKLGFLWRRNLAVAISGCSLFLVAVLLILFLATRGCDLFFDPLKAEGAGAQLRSLPYVVREYEHANGRLPNAEEYEALVQSLSSGRCPLRIDPWGTEILYEVRGPAEFVLRSCGSDGEVRTSDDIVVHVVEGRRHTYVGETK